MLHRNYIRMVILIMLSFSTLLVFVSAKKCRQQRTSEKQDKIGPAPSHGDYLIWETLGSVVTTFN